MDDGQQTCRVSRSSVVVGAPGIAGKPNGAESTGCRAIRVGAFSRPKRAGRAVQPETVSVSRAGTGYLPISTPLAD